MWGFRRLYRGTIMKIRYGFVSNSSSSSFLINKNKLSSEQVEKIYNHQLDKDFGEGEDWTIQEVGECIMGFVGMDNFDMETYLLKIGIAEEDVAWG